MAEEQSNGLANREVINEDKMNYIGFGYDVVNGNVFNVRNLKSRVFSPPHDTIIFDSSSKSDLPIYFTTYSKKALTDKINASLGVKAKFACFKADVKGSYDFSETNTEETAFTYITYTYHKGVERLDSVTPRHILKNNLLDPQFEEDINDPNIPASYILNYYGTHALANNIIHGARFSYYITHTNTEHKKAQEIKAELKAKVFSVDVNAKTDIKSDENNITKNMSCEFTQCGGNVGDKAFDSINNPEELFGLFKMWKNSLKDNGNGEDIISVGGIIGLWEFAKDPKRKAYLKEKLLNVQSYDTHTIASGNLIFSKQNLEEIDALFDNFKDGVLDFLNKEYKCEESLATSVSMFNGKWADIKDVELLTTKDIANTICGEYKTLSVEECRKYDPGKNVNITLKDIAIMLQEASSLPKEERKEKVNECKKLMEKAGKVDKPINEYVFVPFTLYGGEDSPEFNGFPENIVVTGTLKGDDVKITKSKNQY